MQQHVNYKMFSVASVFLTDTVVTHEAVYLQCSYQVTVHCNHSVVRVHLETPNVVLPYLI